MGDFRRLDVYRRAAKMADSIAHHVNEWPQFGKWTVGVQLVRSADSIGANIAEATGRESLADERRLLLIARGSAYEAQHWIDRAMSRDLELDPRLSMEISEIGRMLNGLIRASKQRTSD